MLVYSYLYIWKWFPKHNSYFLAKCLFKEIQLIYWMSYIISRILFPLHALRGSWNITLHIRYYIDIYKMYWNTRNVTWCNETSAKRVALPLWLTMLPRFISLNNCCYICQHNIGRIIILEQQHQSFAALTSLEWLALLLFSFLFTGTVFTVEWLRESLFTSCLVFWFAQIFSNATSSLALLHIYFVLL